MLEVTLGYPADGHRPFGVARRSYREKSRVRVLVEHEADIARAGCR
jgi:hypothetical protein